MTIEMHINRWGDPAHARPLAEGARSLVDLAFGVAETPAVELAEVRVPDSTLSDDLLDGLRDLVGSEHVLLDHDTRALRTRGKSTPDLLRLRAGDASDAPDAVVRPRDHDQVQAVVSWAAENRVALVPFGGGTSVVGGLSIARSELGAYGDFRGVVSLDLIRLDQLLRVDHESRTATLHAGLRGPDAEGLLAEQGLTLGHFPQSFEFATIGGFAVTRSSGQASSGYGRFDSLVVGLRVATPQGTWELGVAPATAAGPDLRELVMGSEGAFGVVTEVTVRVRPISEVKEYDAWRFASFADGWAAMRALAQAGVTPTVLRLSDENESAVNLADPSAVGGDGAPGGCLMVAGHEGSAAAVAAQRAAVTEILTAAGGTHGGPGSAQSWADGRFHGPYLRDSLLDVGVLVETFETATFWSRMPAVYAAVKEALEATLGADGQTVLVLCHVSHVYETGASLYFTVAAKAGPDPEAQWWEAKRAASDAMTAAGATITHHHAIGRDHKPWLEREIGPVGVEVLRAVKERIDPTGVLNPGVLIP